MHNGGLPAFFYGILQTYFSHIFIIILKNIVDTMKALHYTIINYFNKSV